MRFAPAAAAVAFMAGSVLADGVDSTMTDYTTEIITITDCDATVTDCPARKTTTTTEVLPLTTSTVYSHRLHTITSCAPEVTDCPAHSTHISTEIVSLYTTVCPYTPGASAPTGVPTAPAWSNSTTPAGGAGENTSTDNALPTGTGPASGPASGPVDTPTGDNGTPSTVVPGTELPPAPTGAQCGGKTVKPVVKLITTVLTQTDYVTADVPCPTGNNPSGAGTPTGGSGVPTTPFTPIPTAGAATLAGSAVFAAVAGVAALVLA